MDGQHFEHAYSGYVMSEIFQKLKFIVYE